ncbi:MAG: sensor histidine kinase [Thermomicrobiales bacterium]
MAGPPPDLVSTPIATPSIAALASATIGYGDDAERATLGIWLRDAIRTAAWPLAAVNLFTAIAILVFPIGYAVRGEWIDALDKTIWGVLFLGYTIAGILILSRYPQHRIGWTLIATSTVYLFTEWTYFYGIWGLRSYPGELIGTRFVVQTGFFYPLGLYLALVELPLIFPHGRLAHPGWNIARVVGLGGAIGASLAIGFVEPGTMNNEFGPVSNPWLIGGSLRDVLATIGTGPWRGFVLIWIAGIPAAIGLFWRLRHVGVEEQLQLKWMSWFAVIVAAAYCMHLYGVNHAWYLQPYGWIPHVIWGIGLNALPIVIVIAILRFHLYEIDFIINRTIVYTVLSVVGFITYLVLTGTVGAVLGHIDWLENQRLIASLLATATIAVLFQPLRDVLRRSVNRMLFGYRDDPNAVLARLGQRLEASAAPELVLPAVAQTVAEALKLPYVAVAVAAGKGSDVRVVASAGDACRESLSFPMVYQHEWVGELRVSPRAPGEQFARSDRQTLEGLARQAAVSVYAVRLNMELRVAREQLVTTREEERLRLRRDLHDGLGSHLAALTIQAGTARRLLRSDIASAEIELVDLQSELRSAIGEIRRLVHGLRPPALDEVGLVGALRARMLLFQIDATSAAGEESLSITLDAPDTIPLLPAAVEVVLYRIVEEALTNIVRHAGARHAHLWLRVEDEGVCLRITDDGHGMRTDAQAGVGLVSMRERTAELGGSLQIGPNAPSGTTITVSFPRVYGLEGVRG